MIERVKSGTTGAQPTRSGQPEDAMQWFLKASEMHPGARRGNVSPQNSAADPHLDTTMSYLAALGIGWNPIGNGPVQVPLPPFAQNPTLSAAMPPIGMAGPPLTTNLGYLAALAHGWNPITNAPPT